MTAFLIVMVTFILYACCCEVNETNKTENQFRFMSKDELEAMRNYERLQRSIYVSNYLPDMYAAHSRAYNGNNYVNAYDLNPILSGGHSMDPYGHHQSYQLAVAEDEAIRRATAESLNISPRPSAPPHPPPYSASHYGSR
jgi:outer membrane biogenesis lipoprotein LolB